jgi:hypothetical protein
MSGVHGTPDPTNELGTLRNTGVVKSGENESANRLLGLRVRKLVVTNWSLKK